MTTYSTGNDVGSVDVRDLYDNAENLDYFSVGTADNYPDRFGVSRQSLQGIRNASQYQFLGAYAAGLQFTAYNQTFSYLGEFYAPSPAITLPYTTTGAGAPEIANFRSVGDAVLRQDLLQPTGAERVGYGARTVRDRLLDSTSPLDYGAVGDGVVEDAWAVQQAIDAAALLGVPVSLAGKTYRCSEQIIIPSGARINGPGHLIAGSAVGFPVAPHLGFLVATEKTDIVVSGVVIDISGWTSLPAGVASLRGILFRRCVSTKVQGCTFKTTGGGPAFIGCKDISVLENEIISVPVGGVTNGYADGMIDVWVEWDIDAQRCVVAGNIIRGLGFGRFGVMLTGLTFEAQEMQVDSVVVANNVIDGMYYDGIWAFGRNGVFQGTTITGNAISNARKGISLSDCLGVSVVGNSIRETRESGIHLWTETSWGGTVGATGGTISGNSLYNVAKAAGSPIAIWIDGTSSRNVVSGNSVTGTQHFYGITVSPSALYNELGVNAIQLGRGPKYYIQNTKTKYPGLNYTPILAGTNNIASLTLLSARAQILGEMAFVFFRINVTPTTAGVYTRLTITLPYDADITTYSLFGGASQSTDTSAFVAEDPSGDKAVLQFTPAVGGARDIAGWFSYRLTD